MRSKSCCVRHRRMPTGSSTKTSNPEDRYPGLAVTPPFLTCDVGQKGRGQRLLPAALHVRLGRGPDDRAGGSQGRDQSDKGTPRPSDGDAAEAAVARDGEERDEDEQQLQAGGDNQQRR